MDFHETRGLSPFCVRLRCGVAAAVTVSYRCVSCPSQPERPAGGKAICRCSGCTQVHEGIVTEKKAVPVGSGACPQYWARVGVDLGGPRACGSLPPGFRSSSGAGWLLEETSGGRQIRGQSLNSVFSLRSNVMSLTLV